MMTREQRQAAVERCRAAGLAYLVIPQEDDLPGLLVPGAKDASEHEFQRTIVPLASLQQIVTQALGRIERGAWLAFIGASAAKRNGQPERPWRQFDQILRQQKSALEMARAFIPRTNDGLVEYGQSVLGGSWGEGVQATLYAVKQAEGRLLLLVDRVRREPTAVLAEDDAYRTRIDEAVSDLEVAIVFRP